MSVYPSIHPVRAVYLLAGRLSDNPLAERAKGSPTGNSDRGGSPTDKVRESPHADRLC